MKFLAFIFASVLAVCAVDASSLRVSDPDDIVITDTVHTPIGEPGSDATQDEHRGLVEFYDDFDYKKIYVHWTGKGNRCWDVKYYKGYYIPYAVTCKNIDSQYWTYTKDGQIYNKYYEQCLSYDYDKQYEHYWYDSKGKKYPTYIYLDDCDDVSWQRFLYVDQHWVSGYDGYCIDLVRDGGGYFQAETCKKCWKDHEYTIEDYWFSYFDESQCDR
jgi:hypothetical protein